MRSLLPILTTVLLLLLSEQVLASSLRHRSVATSESSLSRVLEGGYGENTPKPDKPIGGGGGNGGEADKGGSEGQEGEGQEGEGKEGEGKDDNQEEDDHDGIESEDHSEGFGNMKRPLCRHAKTWTKLKTENKEGIDDKRVALLRKLEGSEAEKKPESEGERPEGERPESERFHYDDRSGNKSHVLFSAFQPPNAWHVAFTSNTTDVHDYLFPVFPAVETSVQGGCYTDQVVGYMLTGTPLYSWAAESFPTQTDPSTNWHLLAYSSEQTIYDACNGHGHDDHHYHYHGYSHCVAKAVNDTKTDGHSPIYGFAKDGFPIFGPYQSLGVSAKSCWAKRNYTDVKQGCADGKRSCVLVNPLDLTEGVSLLAQAGPDFTSSFNATDHGTPIIAVNGVFFEDYFFNQTCLEDNASLDVHNGHSHGKIGYHYHLTIDEEDRPVFPYAVGPRFYGCLSSLTSTMCSNSSLSNYGIDVIASSKMVSTCGNTTLDTNNLLCSKEVYSFYQPTRSPSYIPRKERHPKHPTFQPTARVAVLIKVTSSMTLTGLSSSTLDDVSRDVIVNATANILHVKENEVEVVSEKSADPISPQRKLLQMAIKMLATSNSVDVGLQVTVNAIDFPPGTDPNTIYNDIKTNLETTAKNGVLASEIQQVASLLGSSLLTNVNVTGVNVEAASIVQPETNNNKNDANGLSTSAIIGIVVGGVVLLILIALTVSIFFCCCRQGSATNQNTDPSLSKPTEVLVEAELLQEKQASCPSYQDVVAVAVHEDQI